MTTRLLAPLSMITVSLGIFALFAGARGYPLVLITAGGIVLAVLCFHPGGAPAAGSSPAEPETSTFSMPPVGSCPPERLREARDLAARVVASSDRTGSPPPENRR